MNIFEKKIAILLSLVAILTLVTATMVYLSMTDIVRSLHKEIQPDKTLAKFKELVSYVNEVEGNVKMFSLTGKDSYIESYDEIHQSVNSRFENIDFGEDSIGNQILQDSVKAILDEKLEIWNELIVVGNAVTNHDSFEQIYRKLSKMKSDEKGGAILQRGDRIDTDKLTSEIAELEREYIIQNQTLILREFELNYINKELTKQLNETLSFLEHKEDEASLDKLGEAEKQSRWTSFWIWMFCITALLMIVLALSMIYNYLRKSRTYQDALMKAKQDAEELSEIKELFISNVSNELQTPAKDIHNLASHLLQMPINRQAKEKAITIKKSSEYMMRQVHGVLDFSLLRSGKIALNSIKFYPYKVLVQTCDMFEDLIRQKGLQFICELNVTEKKACMGDPERLKQILIEILNNALKFTKSGHIKVEATIDDLISERSQLLIVISDSGIGMTDIDKKALSTDFKIGGKVKGNQYEGAGFGFSIVRYLLELHKGEIKVDSEEGKGTVVTLMIPYSTR